MRHFKNLRIIFKTISCVLVITFLWQQISWAGDLLDSSIEKLTTDQSQTFGPQYLQEQQTTQEGLIATKQAIEDAPSTQNLTTSEAVETPPDETLPLQGPKGGSGPTSLDTGSSTIYSLSSEGSPTPSGDGSVLSVTTQSGDIIHYKNGQVDYVEQKDGTILRNIVVDENNNLVSCELTYTDGSTQTVVGGKVSQMVKPDGTIIYYDDNELVSSVLYPDTTLVTWSYIKDGDGNIVETILTDPEKISRYDSDNYLAKVGFNTGKIIEYSRGVISKLTEPDGGQFIFEIKNNPDSTITSTLSQYVSAAGAVYRYSIDDDNNLSYITIERDGAVATYNKDGVLLSVTKDAQAIDDEAIARAQADYDAALLIYQDKAGYTKICQDNFDIAYNNLVNAQLAKLSAENTLSDGNPYIVSSYVSNPDGSLTLNQYKNFINDQFDSYNSNTWYKPADTLVAIAGGSATLKGTGSNYNATFYSNQSYIMTDRPVFSTTFKVSSTSGKFITGLDGYAAGGAYLRVGVYVYGGKIYLQTVTGSTASNKDTLVSTAKANTNYNVDFEVTGQDIKVYLWEATAQRPTSPSYTYTVTDWAAIRPYYSLYSGTATVDYATLKGPSYSSTYNSNSQLIKDAYQNGINSIYSYATDRITVSDCKKYLKSPYDLSTEDLWYKPVDSLVTIASGVATLKGTGSNYNATFYSNQTFARADDVTVRSTFQVSSTSGKFIAAVDGYTSSNAYRRVGVAVQSGRIYVQTISGTYTSTPKTLVSGAKANTNYTVEFEVTASSIKIYLWASSGSKPTSPSYTYAVTDWAAARPYYSLYSGTAAVSNVYINYISQTRTIAQSSAEWNQILARNQAVKNLTDAAINVNNAQASYDTASTTLDSAKADEDAAKAQADSLITTLNAMLSTYSIFPKEDSLLQGANSKIEAVNIIYDAERRTKQVYDVNGGVQDYADGLLNSVSGDSAATLYSYDLNALGGINGITVERDGIKRIYDKYGNLSQISGGDVSLSFNNNEVLRVVKDDGTIIEDAIFEGSDIVDAKITKPDGVVAIYKNKVVVEMDLPDGSKYFYDGSGATIKYISKSGIVYDYSSIEEDNQAFIVATAQDAEAIEDASEIVYQKYNQNKRLVQIIAKDGTVSDYSYTEDQSGNVISIQVSDGSTVTVYDSNNNIIRQDVLATAEDPLPTISEYEYGRIRRVYKADELIYRYSYEFNEEGKEITVIEDVKTGDVNRYKNALLVSVTDLSGLLTEYEYSPDGKICKSKASRLGKIINQYTYTYDGDLTVIEDMEGVRRTYDKDNKLIYLEERGQIYGYTYNKDDAGNETTTQELIKVRDTNGSLANYKNGALESIVRADGAIITNILITDGALSGYIMEKSGNEYFVEGGHIVKEIAADGTETEYYPNGYKKSVKTPDGDITNYTYEYYASESLPSEGDNNGAELITDTDNQNILELAKLPKDPLLLHFNDTVDSSGSNHLIIFNGDAYFDTTNVRFGTTSLALDGNGDYVIIPDSEDWNFGHGDFTIDFWIRPHDWSEEKNESFYAQFIDGTHFIQLYKRCIDGKIAFIAADGTTRADYETTNAPSISNDTWYHIALVRSGTDLKLYINGVSEALTANTPISTNAMPDLSWNPGIGSDNDEGNPTLCFNGWFDEYRVSKGIARWAGDFTPPAESYESDQYTKLLLHCEPINATGYKPVSFFGDAHLDSAGAKLGASSLVLDGNGDYTAMPDSDDWNVCDGNDFTIDFWIKWNAIEQGGIVGQTNAAGDMIWEVIATTGNPGDGVDSIGFYAYDYNTPDHTKASYWVDKGTWAPSLGAWYHIAIVRTEDACLIFIDGESKTVRVDQSFRDSFNVDGVLKIGMVDNNYFNGSIDELRISKGVACWISDFTPPNAEYKNIYYENAGSFTSNPILIEATQFNTISWNKIIPEGTSITLQTSTGNTNNPDDGSWSEWSGTYTDSNGSVMTSPAGKYIRYKVNLTTNDPAVTPKITLSGENGIKIDYITNTTIGERMAYVVLENNGMISRYGENEMPSSIKFDSTLIDSASKDITSFMLPDATIVKTDNFKADLISKITLSEGTVIKYFNNKPFSILMPDGSTIDNIIQNVYKNTFIFTAHNAQGDTYVFENSILTEIDLASGSIIENPAPDQFSQEALTIAGDSFSPDELNGEKEFKTSNISLNITKDNKVTYFIDGRTASIYQRYESGVLELLSNYSYDEDGNLILVRLPYARNALDTEIAAARQRIAEEKADYLRTLAEQKGLAYTSIAAQVQNIRDQINAERSRLQPMLYQQVTRVSQGCWGPEYYTETVEVPEVRNALNQLNEQERQLNNEEANAYAQLDSEVMAAQNNLDQEGEAALNEVAQQEAKMQAQIINEEATPVILEYYRAILGRDPDDAETEYWLSKVDYNSKIDVTQLKDALANSQERLDQEAFVGNLKNQIKDALYNYLDLTEEGKETFLQTLCLTVQDAVALDRAEVDKIVAFLDTQNIHFGRSAFVSLAEMLDANGISYNIDELALNTTLVDILTGTISSLSEGKLLELSMYSLSKTAETYGLTLYNTKLDFSDIEAAFISSGKVIAHLNNNHFVVIDNISSDGKVTYKELNRGRNGHIWTVSKDEFLKSWTGYAITKVAPQDASKILSTWAAQNIKGSCLPFLIPLIIGICSAVSAVASVVVGAISVVVAGISALLAPIISGIGALISGVANFMVGIGSAVFNAVSFVGSSLLSTLGQVGSWLGGIGSAIFGANGLGGIISATGFNISTGIGAAIAKTVVTTVLSFGISKGLESLGVNSTISNLISSFVTGGVSGLFNSGLSALSFITGGIQGLAIQGVNQLGAALGVDPMLTNVISNTAGMFIGAVRNNISPETGLFNLEGFSASIGKQIFPTIARDLSFAGLTKTFDLLGVDSRLGSALSGFSSSLIGNTLSGADIATSFSRAINSSIVSVGVNLLEGIDPAFSAISSTGLMGALENILNEQGLFNGIFGILDRVASSAFNAAGEIVGGIFGGAKTFVELVTESGPLAAMNNALNSLFTRQTVEAVVAQGGMEAVLAKPSNQVVLPDGRPAQEIAITNDSSIFLNEAGEIISIKEKGITATGSFVWTQNNGIQLKEGTVSGNMETGYNILADIEDGKAKDIKTWSINGETIEINPEKSNTPIEINSASNSPSEFNFLLMNAVLSFANAFIYKINQETVKSIEQKVNAISAGSLFNDTNKFLYALANGISNPNYMVNPPQYILNEKQDIVDHSNAAISLDDIFPIVLYKGMTTSLPLNGFFDAARWLVESQCRYKGELVAKAQTDLISYFATHPGEWTRLIVGVGYSGGFMPLAEAVSSGAGLLYNTKTLVGLGAPTAYLPGIIPAALLQLMDAVAANNLSLATATLLGMGWGYGAITGIDQIKEIILTKVRELVQESNLSGEAFPLTLNTKTELIVNVWGTEDTFYKDFGVAGPRSNFLGKSTYNIEIVGADHFDYIRGINPASNPTWNNTVASFCTDLIIASDNVTSLEDFINIKINQGVILPLDDRGVYVVHLPGSGI